MFTFPKGYLPFWLTDYNFVRIYHLYMHARRPADHIFLNVVVVVTYCVGMVNKMYSRNIWNVTGYFVKQQE
jgi:hypothetical protein